MRVEVAEVTEAHLEGSSSPIERDSDPLLRHPLVEGLLGEEIVLAVFQGSRVRARGELVDDEELEGERDVGEGARITPEDRRLGRGLHDGEAHRPEILAAKGAKSACPLEISPPLEPVGVDLPKRPLRGPLFSRWRRPILREAREPFFQIIVHHGTHDALRGWGERGIARGAAVRARPRPGSPVVNRRRGRDREWSVRRRSRTCGRLCCCRGCRP